MDTAMTRRDVLKGAALGAAATGLAALAPVALGSEAAPAFDREVDFLVVGYGLA